uniref:PP2C family protein-serine/threonine phosphatase n=1 Tax=Sporichthya sp. TaxID=65475 RepID=UPI00184CC182
DRARAATDRARAAEDRDRAAHDRRRWRSEVQRAYRDELTGLDTHGLIARLRREASIHDDDLAALHARLDCAEDELQDLRAIQQALTPPHLPTRPGLDLSAAFLPAAERVSGDFYLVAEGPDGGSVLVVGDVVGHGLHAARRATFVRTAFLAIAPFSDDPTQLLNWVNTALIERAGTGSEFITAACLTYLPSQRRLRWAYAGHPPALWLDGGVELTATRQGIPLGIDTDLGCLEGSRLAPAGTGILLYTDGLTEARREGSLLGIDAVTRALAGLRGPTPAEAIAALSALAADYTTGALTDDLCLLAARMN